MRFRSTSTEQASSSPRATGPHDAASRTTRSRGLGRKRVLLALGLVAVAYAVSRYVGMPTDVPSRADVQELPDWVPSSEAIREQTTDAVPGDFQEIPIGEQGSEDGEPGADNDLDETESTAETGAGAVDEGVDDAANDTAGEELDDAETTVDMTDEERSPTEIAERADEDVPEPGEMAVDEDVADELVDTDEADAVEREPDEDEE